jgi:uncharacterized protein YegL
MCLFFILDTSGSMHGNKIGALNQAISEVMPMLDDISANNADAEIHIAALQFSSGCQWIYDEPKPADQFRWIDRQAEGLTDLGAAYHRTDPKTFKRCFYEICQRILCTRFIAAFRW